MKFVKTAKLVSLCAFSLLVACGGGSGGGDVTSNSGGNAAPDPAPAVAEDIQIFGAGVKGPLAFADTRIYRLDTTFPDFYDRNDPVSSAITNEFAQISGLSVPADMQPPFILTIGGSNAIDLNTSTAPVIQTLVTVITREMLTNRQPIYATPLTTMAFQVARHGSGTSSDTGIFLQQLTAAAVQVETLFSIDQTTRMDIFRSPVVINNSTVTAAEQKEAVYHRAALEAFAAKVNALSVAAGNVSTDLIIDRLALDLESDGVIDNTENGNAIGAIDPVILSKDPMTLVIPNTQYRIKDVMNLMEDERTLLGTAATGPSFNKNQITLPIAAAPAIIPNSFPANLQGTAPEESTVIINIRKPANVDIAMITLTVLDADFSGEGELIINGNTPVALFGPTATSSNNNLVVNVPITTPANYWRDGDNTLVFRHTKTAGFSIQDATVSFQVAAPAVFEPVITLSTTSIQFGDQDVGGVSVPKLVKLTNSGNAPFTISSISISTTPGFSQTNDCNRYLPVNSTCTFSISFTPISAGTVTGAMAISGDFVASAYRVKFSGTGKSGSTTTSDITVVAQSSGQVLKVDFDSHPIGPYTEQNAIDDFDADQSTGPGWSRHTNDSDIVTDPTGDSSRGNVMRVTHLAQKGGRGPRFKVRLPAADEYYLSYDIFIPGTNELIKQEKMPGLMYGSMLDATHAYGQKPQAEGVKALLAMIQLLKPGTYPIRGNTNQLTAYIYDADRVQYNRWFNLVDPVDSATETTWSFPKGKWVKIEQRVKQNTATAQEGVGDRRDGILQTWVDGQLAVDRQYMHWRTVNTMHVDGIFFYNYYGGDPNDPENKPSKDQHTYFDNFIVSTSPITH